MIRRRLSSPTRSEIASAKPQRRRISGIPSPPIRSDQHVVSTDDDLVAELRRSQLAEARRVREAIRREIGGDVLSIVHESLSNMSSRDRRRFQSLLDRCLAGR